MDKNLSPSISGEANAVKMQFTHNAAEKHTETKKGLMRRLRESIDPEGASLVYLDTAKNISKGIAEIAEDLKAAGTPAEYAAAQAYEIYQGNRHLFNIGKSFQFAESELDDNMPYEKPSDTFMDDYISSVEDVNDDAVLKIFGKLLAEEIKSNGSVSKATLSTLKIMDTQSARAFEKACSLHHDVNGNTFGPLVYFVNPMLLELVDLAQDDINDLSDLNLIRLSSERQFLELRNIEHSNGVCNYSKYYPYKINENGKLTVGIEHSDGSFEIEPPRRYNQSETDPRLVPVLDLGYASFTKMGMELANVLNVPPNNNLQIYMQEAFNMITESEGQIMRERRIDMRNFDRKLQSESQYIKKLQNRGLAH